MPAAVSAASMAGAGPHAALMPAAAMAAATAAFMTSATATATTTTTTVALRHRGIRAEGRAERSTDHHEEVSPSDVHIPSFHDLDCVA